PFFGVNLDDRSIREPSSLGDLARLSSFTAANYCITTGCASSELFMYAATLLEGKMI
ncbi:hypothetical protein THAOC_04015, partial [Thalassiosira oceanica]